MKLDQTFKEQYDSLQSQWRQLAKNHGHHYLQYLAPRSPVDYVLVGKMTSIGEKDAAKTKPGCYPAIDPPHFNLHVSLGDLVLNYGAHRHLCKPGETYYLTDLGKCAIPPGRAKGKLQDNEFNKWYPILLEELKLVAKPNATVPSRSAELRATFSKGNQISPILWQNPFFIGAGQRSSQPRWRAAYSLTNGKNSSKLQVGKTCVAARRRFSGRPD